MCTDPVMEKAQNGKTWKEMFLQWKESGLSVSRFSARVGVSKPTFLRKLKKHGDKVLGEGETEKILAKFRCSPPPPPTRQKKQKKKIKPIITARSAPKAPVDIGMKLARLQVEMWKRTLRWSAASRNSV